MTILDCGRFKTIQKIFQFVEYYGHGRLAANVNLMLSMKIWLTVKHQLNQFRAASAYKVILRAKVMQRMSKQKCPQWWT